MKLNIKFAEKLITDNAPTILTSVAVVGTCATGYLAARGAFKAADKLNRLRYKKTRAETGRDSVEDVILSDLTKTEMFKASYVEFLPAVGAGVTTITCTIFAHKISAGRIAALAAAYSLSEGKLKDYKTAIEEKLGIETKKEVDEHFNKMRENQSVPVERQPQRPIIISGDNQLFYDVYSGRYFEASMNDLRSAENDLNYKVIQDNQCPLSHFYELIGLPAIALGDDWGWDATCPPEFKYSPNIDDNSGKACIWVEFEVEPLRGWNHLES